MTLIRDYWPIAILLLTACGPTEQQKAQLAEQRRIECLDKLCEGDVPPKHDLLKEFAFKLNGQWFIGPREYGGYGGSLAFLWPSKTPARSADSRKTAPEFIPSSAGVTSNFYDVGIEIFLQSHHGQTRGPNRHDRLRQAETEGRLISKERPRPGLEVWRTQETDGLGLGLWYVATDYVAADPNGAILSCRDSNPKFDVCTTAFMWQPGIAVDMRFSAKHRAEWPEIYQETIRVLQLLKKA